MKMLILLIIAIGVVRLWLLRTRKKLGDTESCDARLDLENQRKKNGERSQIFQAFIMNNIAL